MPSYENDNCPVCGRKFTAQDDIVTCPYCGTPHHRECYKSLGQCANNDKHGTDFSFSSAKPDNENNSRTDTVNNNQNENQNTEGNVYYTPPAENGKTRCFSCGEEIDSDADYCFHCGAKQPKGDNNSSRTNENQNRQRSIFTMPKTGYENSSETIDGKSVSDAAYVVKTNAQKFIPKFLRNKKLSWNWSAFIFGPYYMFYRKMYKEGSIMLAIRLIVTLVAQGLYAKPFADFYNFIYANSEALSSASVSDSLMSQLEELYTPILPMIIIIVAANVIIHIAAALIADGIYKTKVLGIIDKVNKNIDEGSIEEQAFLMPESENARSITSDDIKKLYFGRLGGTSFFAPFIAYFVYDLITSLISSL